MVLLLVVVRCLQDSILKSFKVAGHSMYPAIGFLQRDSITAFYFMKKTRCRKDAGSSFLLQLVRGDYALFDLLDNRRA